MKLTENQIRMNFKKLLGDNDYICLRCSNSDDLLNIIRKLQFEEIRLTNFKNKEEEIEYFKKYHGIQCKNIYYVILGRYLKNLNLDIITRNLDIYDVFNDWYQFKHINYTALVIEELIKEILE